MFECSSKKLYCKSIRIKNAFNDSSTGCKFLPLTYCNNIYFVLTLRVYFPLASILLTQRNIMSFAVATTNCVSVLFIFQIFLTEHCSPSDVPTK